MEKSGPDWTELRTVAGDRFQNHSSKTKEKKRIENCGSREVG